MDFPGIRPQRRVISSLSAEAIGTIRTTSSGAAASGAWPAANRAIFVPFVVAAPYPVARVWWANGSAVAGNVDCGIYSAAGTKLGSIGSTAQAGTSVVQSVALSLLLHPGSYYMALALSSTTGTTLRLALSTVPGAFAGMAQQATALPLPATFTLAAIASAYLPFFGITSSSVI